MTDPHFRSARQLASDIRRRKTGALEALDAYPARIDRYNPTLNGRRVPATDQLFWAGYPGMAYLPSTVAPCGFTRAGLPVGVQIVGPQYGDRTCIEFARQLEREFQGFVPPPDYR